MLGFDWDVPPRNLKVDPTNTNFSRKSDPFMSFYIPISPILSQIRSFYQYFLKFEPIFGKFWKMDPFVYQILHFIRGHSYTKRLILLACWRHVPVGSFVMSTPPRVKMISSSEANFWTTILLHIPIKSMWWIPSLGAVFPAPTLYLHLHMMIKG